MVDFAIRLKKLRNEKHLTQAQVAERISVTPTMVSAYESDLKQPALDTIVKIANLFGVTVDYLVCREDKRYIDISDLTDEEAAVVCDMIGLLRKKKISV